MVGTAARWLRLMRTAMVPIILCLAVAGCGVNAIPTQEETAKAKWADVQNQYQRRADLIPNLIATVKGYAAQEREVLEAVTNARSRAINLQVPADVITDPEAFKRFQEAQAQLSGALGRLIAVSERYPDLKSNQNFIRLQDELAGTENRIAVERRRYNESVKTYNIKVRSFPTNILAGMFGFEKATFFEVPEAAKTVPKVTF